MPSSGVVGHMVILVLVFKEISILFSIVGCIQFIFPPTVQECSFFSTPFPIFVVVLLFSRLVVSDSLQSHGLQHTSFPVLRHPPELAQTHVHWVDDSIQPSRPLLSPSPPVFNLSQHEGLFQWVGYLHQVAKVLELQLQHQSFQWIFRVDFL